METRLQRLQAALAVYRHQFRTATPLERSVLLMAMRAVMDEVDRLNPPKRYRNLAEVPATTQAA